MQKEIDMAVFAKRLKEARAEKGLTQKELAALSGVSTVMISSYERTDAEAGKNPSLSVVYSIASALDVSIDWLCGQTESQRTNSQIDYLKLFIEMSIYLQPINHFMPKDSTTHRELFYDSKKRLIWNIPLKNTDIALSLISDIGRIRSIMGTGVATDEMILALMDNIYKKYKDMDLSQLFCFFISKDGDENGNHHQTQ